MQDLTMGQRIAQRRKMLNLSQEAFGEKMGVSRQAISKWEADGAVPEIDKLIAMSKLFGVSVDWILGMNTETPEAESREAFTEDQLKLVEEIVRRYQRPKWKPRHVILAIVAAVFAWIVVSSTITSYANSLFDGLRGRIDNLYTYYDHIYGQMYQVSEKLEDLAAGERLLTEYTFEAEGSADLTHATVRFTATPRTTQIGDEAWLSVRLDGEEVAKVPCSMDGTTYNAVVELPAADGYSYYFQVVHATGDTSQEPLTKAYDYEQLATGLRGYFYADHAEYELRDGMMTVDGLLLFYVTPKLLPQNDITVIRDLTLLVTYDGESMLRIPVQLDGEPVANSTYMTDFWAMTEEHFDISFQFPCQWEQIGEVILSAEVTLSTGHVMEQPLVKWEKDGTIIMEEVIPPTQK